MTMISVPTNGARLGLDKEGAGDGNGTRLKADLIPANLIEGRIEAGTSPTMACRYLMEVRQNGRAHQEDCCAVFTWDQEFQDGTSQVHLFTIMDGHSDRRGPSGTFGLTVATRMREAFETTMKGFTKNCFEKHEGDVKQQLADQGMVVDESLQREGLGKCCGTTFSFALVFETHVVIGNVGDSTVFYSCLTDNHSIELVYQERPKTAESFGVDELQACKEECESWYERVLKIAQRQFDRVMDPLNTTSTEDQKEKATKEKNDTEKMVNAQRLDCMWHHEFERVAGAGVEIGKEHIKSKDSSTCLQMTRAFGDFDMKSQSDLGGLEKQAVIARPSMEVVKRQVNKREIIGLFTDGVAFKWSEESLSSRYLETNYYSVYRFLTDTIKTIKSSWNDESLVELSNDMNRIAKNRRKHPDNAGILLVKFQGYHQPTEDEDTDAKVSDDAATHIDKKCKE
mmetsp:Transcript_54393/g.132023  ORF Transcript_54393/g.132023 Transcript_54393/m.132023 type:complete len:454 (-) Transcript_54393:2505-3866(-)